VENNSGGALAKYHSQQLMNVDGIEGKV